IQTRLQNSGFRYLPVARQCRLQCYWEDSRLVVEVKISNSRIVGRFYETPELASDTDAQRRPSFYPSRILSIKRVLPKNTANRSTEFALTTSTSFNVSASATST